MATDSFTCPYCGKPHRLQANFCPETGQRFPRCPDCGTRLEGAPKICPNCGLILEAAAHEAPPAPPPVPVEPDAKPILVAPIAASAPPPLPAAPGTQPLEQPTEAIPPPAEIPATEQLPFAETEALPQGGESTAPAPAARFPGWVIPCAIIAAVLGVLVIAGLAFFAYKAFQGTLPILSLSFSDATATESEQPVEASMETPGLAMDATQAPSAIPTLPSLLTAPAPTLPPEPTVLPTVVTPAPAASSQSFSWSVQTIDKSPEVGAFSSIAVDRQDNIHIAYYDDRLDDLRYSAYKSDLWKYYALTGKEKDGFFSSLSLDNAGVPYIAFYVYDQNLIKVVFYTSNTWRALAPLNNFKFEATNLSLAIDQEERPHIIFSDKRRFNIWYAVLENNRWNLQFISDLKSEDNKADRFPLVLDRTGQPRTCFYNKNTGLNYAYLSNGAWTVENVDPNPGAGTYPSLSLDSNDVPHIAYYDQLNHALKHAYWNGEKWVIETVDTSGDVGSYASITIGKNDLIHISYYDADNADLKYAFWNGNSWTTTTVDAEGEVGTYNSIALDQNGAPRISYYDATNKWLKLATASTK
jgi:hypothetical protein